jgi:molybdate transport system regulatory protein
MEEPMENDVRLGINIWMENEKGVLFGRGRMLMLEEVKKLGSLKHAAESMNMSYRAAWGKIKKSEEAWGAPLIEKQGSNRAGYKLTSFGNDILAAYKTLLDEVRAYAEEVVKKKFKQFKAVENHAEFLAHAANGERSDSDNL